MQPEQQDIYGNIISVEFRKFFNEKFANSLKQNEKKRILYIVFLVLVSVFNTIMLFLIFQCLLFAPINAIKLTCFLVLFLLGIYSICYIVKSYKNKMKSFVMNKLLSFIGDFKINKINKRDLESIHTLKLFNGLDFPAVKNYITGKYGLLKIEIVEAQNKKSEFSKIPIFKGVLIKVPCIKKIKNYTIIKRKDSITFIDLDNKINIDDSEFEKYYDVYSDDKVEARWLLTASFKNRMVQLANHEIGKDITISFENNNLYIAIDENKDWLDISILKSATDISNYRAVVLEIISILKIIDSLKLEQNIGL